MNNIYLFDLDDTLFPIKTIKKSVGLPLLNELNKNNKENTCYTTQIEKIFNDCWILPLDSLAEKYNFSQSLYDSLQSAYKNLEVNHPVFLYDDAIEVLKKIKEEKQLVTTGYKKLQNSKINKLNISAYFTQIHIDEIDSDKRKNKRDIFIEIMKKTRLNKEKYIVVGDNLNSEIKYGNELGMTTVYINRDNKVKKSEALYTIHSLFELKDIL